MKKMANKQTSMNMRYIFVIVVLFFLVFIAYIFYNAYKNNSSDTVLSNTNISLQSEQVALHIAWEAVMETNRYKSWNVEGLEYKADPHPTYNKEDVKYKPELWTVDFDLPDVTDQNMYVDVNIDTGKVLYLHEYEA